MTLLAVPNVSEGRDRSVIERLTQAAQVGSVRLLDLHTDAVHNRSVLTLTGEVGDLVEGCVSLAAACRERIDLTRQSGVHPRLGALDVNPFVPHADAMSLAVSAAEATSSAIGDRLGIPVYLYGRAARRAATRELPAIRKGGLAELQERALSNLPPDAGPDRFDERCGVVCVGARGPLIAFNVWIESDVATARAIAAHIRSSSVRALGLQIEDGTCQVSMNLIDPEVTGIGMAFEKVAATAEQMEAAVTATEIVGLVEERFLPSPDATVTRLLLQPGHSLEASLGKKP